MTYSTVELGAKRSSTGQLFVAVSHSDDRVDAGNGGTGELVVVFVHRQTERSDAKVFILDGLYAKEVYAAMGPPLYVARHLHSCGSQQS